LIATPQKTGFAILLVALLILPQIAVLNQILGTPSFQIIPDNNITLSDTYEEPTPLRRAAFVAPNPNSYIDEFAYMAAVPTSIFYNDGTKYTSPLILSSGSDSEKWLIEDWVEYLAMDGGVSQGLAIGDFSNSEILSLQELIGTKIYPRITGDTSAEIAAMLALNEWQSSETVVLSLAKDSFTTPTITSGEAPYIFSNPQIAPFSEDVIISDSSTVDIVFTPPTNAGWFEGSFNWTGSEYFTHTLEDPTGRIVDYSLLQQVIPSRSAIYVDNPVPLHFWLPYSSSNSWTMHIHPTGIIEDPVTLSCDIVYHPGFTQTITVPSDAKWLNVSANWDNAGTILNLALLDPDGHLVQWAPAESLISGAGSKSLNMPYPMVGDWTFLAAWMDPVSDESNNVDVSWDISTLPSDLQRYMESASNGAVLASLLNAPLLYVNHDSVPAITEWALSQLGVTSGILVDPTGLQTTDLTTELSSLVVGLSNLSNYPMVSDWIHTLSGSNDIVLTIPLGDSEELFAPSAYSGAFHGAPVFSLCGDDNLITTRAEETWAPYQIGPEIDIFIQSRYTTKTENGWYDERIPNIYSMFDSATEFESFIDDRGAFNDTVKQEVVIVSPTNLLKTSFDRSLQSHFISGRIPTKSASMASILINRAAHHRFLFTTTDNADEALLSFYAYTNNRPYAGYQVQQVENSVSALESGDFSVQAHIGAQAVFDSIASQVALWSLSTHGTLTQYPTDPPQRPEGLGIFSMRDIDMNYAVEVGSTRDSNGDGLVNPVQFSAELERHTLRTTEDLEGAIDNIGSPIVIITACLLGGSTLPSMLMEHGAVAVTAAPRTVYFTPAGLLAVLLTESLVQGNTTGEALNFALREMSFDYTDSYPSPVDYANQQILFGDPSVKLYHPDSTPRIAALNPRDISLDGHTPARGTPSVVGLGQTDIIPQSLTTLSTPFDFYDASNYSDFVRTSGLRTVVIVEPDSLSSLASGMSSDPEILEQFVHNGGTLVILGVSSDIDWLPWDVSYRNSVSGTSITLVDTGHPLLNNPNSLSTSVEYNGYFSSVSSNFTSLATDGTNSVIIACAFGTGKLALTTTNPSGSETTNYVENVIHWNATPSLIVKQALKNQEIIWEGDIVTVTLEISDLVGTGIAGADVSVWMNDTEVAITESGDGFYTFTLEGEWTNGKSGIYSLKIHATKSGYDTLSVVLIDFMFIRPSPILFVGILGGGAVAVLVTWSYIKRKRGDPDDGMPRRKQSPKRSKLEKDEQKRKQKEEKARRKARREADKKFDAKEFFDV